MVYDVTKMLDNTRPVIANSGSYPTSRTDVHDVHDYEQDPEKLRSYYAEIDKDVVYGQIQRKSPNDRRFKFAPERYARIFGEKAIIE